MCLLFSDQRLGASWQKKIQIERKRSNEYGINYTLVIHDAKLLISLAPDKYKLYMKLMRRIRV